VYKTDQQKRGIRSEVRPAPRILTIVVMKLMEPRIDDTPARCNEKIPKSTAMPG